MRTWIFALLTLVALVRSASAACRGPLVSTADQICSGAGTCQVTQPFCIVSGSTLDFAGRDLVLKKSGTLDVQGGSMLIKATNITLEGGSALQGVQDSGGGGSIDIQARTGDIVAFKDALIDVHGAPAGRLDIEAVGTVRIAGDLRANGTSDDGDGGTVTIDAQAIDIPGTLQFFGQGEGFAGDATLLAVAGFSLAGTVDGAGRMEDRSTSRPRQARSARAPRSSSKRRRPEATAARLPSSRTAVSPSVASFGLPGTGAAKVGAVAGHSTSMRGDRLRSRRR